MKYLHTLAAATVVLLSASTAVFAGGDLKGDPVEDRCSGGRWEGPYIGAQVGWVSADADQSNIGVSLSSEDDAFSAGVLGGYNRQCGRVVFGIRSDINWTDVGSSATIAGQTFTSSYDYYGTLRGRLGITHEDMLFYVTGGLAYADVDHALSAPAFGVNQSDSDMKFGYVVGGGIEFMRDDRWTLRAEALYVDLGDSSESYVGTTACGAICRANVEWDDDFFVGRIGLTMKLHREEPVHEPLK
ncbi:MAG: porin family protein [Hyphomicrobium sp.]|nr:porin family protein [Hyphomicrobium sp.]